MKKSNSLPVFLILSLLFILTSCEEVIRLELKNAEPRVVIDATLNAGKGECMVQVSKSLGFYQNDSIIRLEGVTVELVKGSGTALSLAETSPGVYSVTGLTVNPGEVYRVNVILSPEERYSAQTKTPEAIFLDSLKVVRGFGDPRPTSPPIYLIKPKWKDPAGVANFYRFKVTTNGRPQSGSLTITNDEPFDGTVVDMPLYRYGFAIGDTVRLEFQSIDSLSYSYFTQINDMARPSFVSATPYNPVGNFDNGALGYFGIYWSEVRDLIILGRTGQ
jgi:hypothetical protein